MQVGDVYSFTQSGTVCWPARCFNSRQWHASKQFPVAQGAEEPGLHD